MGLVMSAKGEGGRLGGITAIQTFEELLRAYNQMDMETARYFMLVVTPGALVFVLATAAALSLPLDLLFRIPVVIFGFVALLVTVGYPKARVEQKRQEMEDYLHLAITELTVLSTTKIDRMEVFRTVGMKGEYGALATEINRIVQLVDTWNQSLDDACRIRATQVSSDPVSDFFDRLAYSLGTGQELRDFMLSEQEMIIQNYVTAYQSSLDDLEVMKDLYLSMILAMTFALVFATVLPLLTGNNPTLVLSGIIALYLLVQTGFAYVIRIVSPTDPVWIFVDWHTTEADERIKQTMLISLGFVIILGGIVTADLVGVFTPIKALWPGATVPLPIYAAIPTTPLLLPGLVARREENKIIERDQEFPSFIRALGASESAKQSTTSAVLVDLKTKDFGALTPLVVDLYKRLNFRLDPEEAWEFFIAESHSYLIEKFSEMYLYGRQMGGDPKLLGELISENLNKVLQLREQRRQTTVTFIGLLYGITAASTFAYFIGFQVVSIMSEFSLGLSTDALQVGQLIHTAVYDLQVVEFLLVGILMYNALVSSLMIRTVDGGHKINSYVHFVTLTWLAAIIAVLTTKLTGSILAV